MSFITKNVNIIALFSLILIICVAAAGTHYYNLNLVRKNSIINDRSDQIANLSAHLSFANQQISNFTHILEIQNQRERSFTEQYLGIRTERENLKRDIDSLKAELVAVEKRLDNTQSDLDLTTKYLFVEKELSKNLSITISQKNSELSQKDGIITSLAGQISQLEGQLEVCNNASSG